MTAEYWVLLAGLVLAAALFGSISVVIDLWDKYVKGKEPVHDFLRARKQR